MSYRKKIAHWEGFAKTDPLWSILTDPNKKNGKWDIDEFFQTGLDEMDIIFDLLKSNDWMPSDRASAMDFGCGVGRLTRAIRLHFERTTGIDAAAQMIEMAKQFHENLNNIDFVVNTSDNLDFIADQSISFIYTAIVLQHIPKEQSYQFISEFCRILEPGGTLVFQVPTNDIRKLSPIQKLRVWLKPRERLANLGLWKKYHMDMNVYEDARITDIAMNHDCKIVGRRLTNHTDKAFNGSIRFLSPEEATDYISTLYIIKKEG
jgi:SAM-dependent methyltransferase